MKSRWFQFKDRALELRHSGNSIRYIEKTLGIPRSTLSGWLENVKLSQQQKIRLKKQWRDALLKARKNAIVWHNKQKQLRLDKAREKAKNILRQINFKDANTLYLALAILYLGEGSKKSLITSMGNSDPLILKFFISALRKIYNLELSKFKCDLHLRSDQNPKHIKKYWSSELGLPISNFKSTIIDPRTKGRKTFPDYNGVCVVRCGLVEIQRELVFLSRLFCENAIKYLN